MDMWHSCQGVWTWKQGVRHSNRYPIYWLCLMGGIDGVGYFAFIANIEESVVQELCSHMATGIYYGWARVNKEEIYPMVMSLGWNPFYKNEKRSAVRIMLMLAPWR